MEQTIDVRFDFTRDTPHYWKNFWSNNSGLGGSSTDPDALSKTLQQYQALLWSKLLPCGTSMQLTVGSGANYLTWGEFRFGSDSITASFRYERYRSMLNLISEAIPNYHAFMENYLRKVYTIGGEIIFPKRNGGINQARGCNPFICDRWDLTLECIRRYYERKTSPLYEVLQKDHAFFDLFVDFKGYIEFFLLQDCVSPDFSAVIFGMEFEVFQRNPLPRTVDEYLAWMKYQSDFVEKRNERIRAWVESHPL